MTQRSNKKEWMRAYNKSPARLAIKASRRAACRTLVEGLKKDLCVDCGGVFPPCAMDFDYVRGGKKRKGGVARMMDHPLNLILEEIMKCDLVCANCHRVRTLQRGQYRHKVGP